MFDVHAKPESQYFKFGNCLKYLLHSALLGGTATDAGTGKGRTLLLQNPASRVDLDFSQCLRPACFDFNLAACLVLTALRDRKC